MTDTPKSDQLEEPDPLEAIRQYWAWRPPEPDRCPAHPDGCANYPDTDHG